MYAKQAFQKYYRPKWLVERSVSPGKTLWILLQWNIPPSNEKQRIGSWILLPVHSYLGDAKAALEAAHNHTIAMATLIPTLEEAFKFAKHSEEKRHASVSHKSRKPAHKYQNYPQANHRPAEELRAYEPQSDNRSYS